MKRRASALTIAVFCCVSFTLSALNFYTNCLGSADRAAFVSFVRYSERSIIGRLIKSRQDGILSAGGLSTFAVTGKTAAGGYAGFYADRLDNTDLYLTNGRADFFSPPYRSQICGQGMLYSLLDRALPLPQAAKLRVFHGLSSALTALVLTVILAWFYAECGPAAGWAALLSVLASRWLTVFARDLWWSTWAFYVPPAMVLAYFVFFKKQARPRLQGLGLVIFFSLLFKTVFNGYEYITTTLVMLLVPFVYYCVRDRAAAPLVLRGLGRAALGAGLALAVSLGILAAQVAAVSGQAAEGFSHVLRTFQKRSHADAGRHEPVYADSLRADTLPVVAAYLRGTFMAFPAARRQAGEPGPRLRLSLSYARLIALFALMSLVLYLCARRGPPAGRRRAGALIVATWFSILAPLSWFIVFKAHSYIHQHMNFIVWQMPFTLFGAAVTGLACSGLYRSVLARVTGRPSNGAGCV